MTKRTTRRQRITRALTPKRVRRVQARWRRRKQKAAKRYAAFREVVRRDPRVKCATCGQQVAQPKLKAHLARHDARAAKAVTTARRRTTTRRRETAARPRTAPARSAPELDHPRPSRAAAGRKAAGWFAVSSACSAAFVVLGGGLWLLVAAAAAMAIAGGAYLHERKYGTSDHGARSNRDNVKQAARAAGCSAACMWSIKPVETCRCPCGGSTHGASRKRRVAA